jgi:uncharacterized integral membrane protein
MIILFILGLVLGGGAVVFALQNVDVVTVAFFSWQLTGSLAVILSLAILAGAVAVLLLLLPESLKNYFKYKSLKKEIALLEEELRKQKELTLFAKKNSPTHEDIAAIEQGAISVPNL